MPSEEENPVIVAPDTGRQILASNPVTATASSSLKLQLTGMEVKLLMEGL